MVIHDIQDRVRSGFTDWSSLGSISTKEWHNMVLLNYRHTEDWNEYERVCRGLIIHKLTGEIIARPFDKFFYWGEGGRFGKGYIKNITEKIDGSLGICYRDPVDGVIKITTRGDFRSNQAVWATKYLNKNFTPKKFPLDDYTLLFEIVYPANRIVVNYGNLTELVLLAVRNKHTGEYLPELYEFSAEHELELAPTWSFHSLYDLVAATGDPAFREMEGWVVEMSDGSRWKFKTDEYLTLHKVFSGNIEKQMVKYILNGTLQAFYAQLIPPHLLIDAKMTVQALRERHSKLVDQLESYYQRSPKEFDRKMFALWVHDNVPKDYQHYMFKLYDSQPITGLIWEREF